MTSEDRYEKQGASSSGLAAAGVTEAEAIAKLREFDRLSLVIESAVRRADTPNWHAVSDLVKRTRVFISILGPAEFANRCERCKKPFTPDDNVFAWSKHGVNHIIHQSCASAGQSELADKIEKACQGFSREYEGARQLNLRCTDWDQIVASLRASMPNREAIKKILERFHRNACYPDAMPCEVNEAADAILSAAQGVKK